MRAAPAATSTRAGRRLRGRRRRDHLRGRRWRRRAAPPSPSRTRASTPPTSTRLARAFADFADLKSPWTLGHSPAVADPLAAAAVDDCEPGLAALLHDLGRVSVPERHLGQARAANAAEWERVRLHPYYTERILSRNAAVRRVAAVAAAHHERLDGSGYHRAAPAARADRRPMRLLAAADAYAR